MKRVLAIILTLLMVVSLIPATAIYADAVELTDNSTYNGIRKKSDNTILFSPKANALLSDLNAGTYAYTDLSYQLTFTQLTGSGGSAVYTFPTAYATTPKKANGSYLDIVLKNASLDCGFCPTEGCYYNIYVEVYVGGSMIYYGTYTNVKTAGISGSPYYEPTRIPTDASEIAEPIGSFTVANDTIYFAPEIAELQAALEGGDALSDYEITLIISKLKNGAVSYTWKTPITASLTAGDGCFLVPLCGEAGNVFCPRAGTSYQIEVEIIKSNSKVLYGTYADVACGEDVAECSYYEPTAIAKPIKEADPSYTGQRYYKTGAYQLGFRVNSKGYIMFSPLVADLRADINAGAAYSDFTAYETVTVKDAETKIAIHTYETFSSAFGSSSGVYFDVTLQSNTVDTGFCPAVGYLYDIYCEIYNKSGELVYFGTYSDLSIPEDATTSAYYKPSGIPGVIEYHVSLDYDFANTLTGSAAGKIRMTADNVGSYGLYWADADGEPLSLTVGEKTIPYSALTNVVISKNDVNKEIVLSILPYTVIPMGAAQLIACTTEMETVASVPVPASKQLLSAAPNLTFGMVSDIHYNQFHSDGTTDDASIAFPRALSFYKSAGVDLVTGAGDYGVYQEIESYQSINAAVAAAGLIFLGCGGNHEVYSGKSKIYDKASGLEDSIWRTYMNTGVYSDTPMEGVLNVASNGIDFVYQVPGDDSAVFVFLSQMYNDSGTVTQQHLLDDAQITWLSNQLRQYADKQVYLYFHVYLFDEDGKTISTEGDLTTDAGASYKGGYNTNASEYAAFKALLDQYTNVTWFNGHSHYEYAMQKLNPSLNITDNGGTTATMIHVPSCTCPRTATATSTSLGQLHGKSSEGGLMLSFDDYDVMIGLDFIGDKAYSYASYIIYKDKEDIVTSDTVESITYTYDAQTSSLYFEGEGEIPAASVETPAPWAGFAGSVSKIHLGNGITAIGAGAFAGFAVEELRIPESLTAIGDDAFDGSVGKIIYSGSSASFASIAVGENNTAIAGAAKVYRKYRITFIVGGVSSFVDVFANEVPVYDGIPTKPHHNPEKIYLFAGWRAGGVLSPTLSAAKGDTTYTAVFDGEAVRYARGTIGSGIKWELDRMTGTLTLYGKGTTPDLAAELTAQPWSSYANEIYTVRVSGGITTIGKNTFSRLPVLSTIELCEGIKTLNADAFSYCPLLTTLYLPKSISTVGQGTVYQDKVLSKIYFSGSAAEWVGFKSRITTLYNDGIKNCENVITSTPAARVYEKGDVDGNYTVNIADVTAVLSVIADPSVITVNSPDLTGDQIVNIRDVTALLTILAK